MCTHAITVAALLALLATHGLAGPAAGARRYCARGHLAVETEWREASLVVVGTVRSAERVASAAGDFWDRTMYRVRVDEVLRGRPGAAVTLYSENDSGQFPMELGARYLLFASERDGHVRVDNCGNSGRLPAVGPALARVRALRRGGDHRGRLPNEALHLTKPRSAPTAFTPPALRLRR